MTKSQVKRKINNLIVKVVDEVGIVEADEIFESIDLNEIWKDTFSIYMMAEEKQPEITKIIESEIIKHGGEMDSKELNNILEDREDYPIKVYRQVLSQFKNKFWHYTKSADKKMRFTIKLGVRR